MTFPYLDNQLGTGAMGFVARGATQRPLVVKGAASQTADLQQWQDNAGKRLLNILASGKMAAINDNSDTISIQTTVGVNRFAIGANGPWWRSSVLEQTTVGPAGTAAALPAAPTKYLRAVDSTGSVLLIPAYTTG